MENDDIEVFISEIKDYFLREKEYSETQTNNKIPFDPENNLLDREYYWFVINGLRKYLHVDKLEKDKKK